MKVILQRVSEASCTVNSVVTGSITKGYVCFVGFTHEDTQKDIEYLAKKVAHLRVFEDDKGKLNINIMDKQYAILSISQFTLYGDTKKGNRPSFTSAMKPEFAEKYYEEFNKVLQDTYHIPVETGRFGEHMMIHLVNDGPVTIELETTHD